MERTKQTTVSGFKSRRCAFLCVVSAYFVCAPFLLAQGPRKATSKAPTKATSPSRVPLQDPTKLSENSGDVSRTSHVERPAYAESIDSYPIVAEAPYLADSSHGVACDAMGTYRSRQRLQQPCGLWWKAEYLAWSLDPVALPPLVTTSPLGTAPENTGVLGRAGTRILFGNSDEGDEIRSGARVTLGLTCDPQSCRGFEVSYLTLQNVGSDFNTSSAANPLLARPVFNIANGQNASQLVAHPDFLQGSINVNLDSDLHVLDILRRSRLSNSRRHRLDFLLGYRYSRLEDELLIAQSSRFTAPRGQIIAGTTISLFDQFETENQFHGGEIGLDYKRYNGRWTWGLLAKIALGVTDTSVSIRGQTTNTVPNAGAANFAGGLLAQTTNIGDYDDSTFAVQPELGLTLSGCIRPRLQISVGYSFMYWSSVARAGDQIDTTISQFPPEPPAAAARPRFALATDGLFIHGLQAGLTYRF